MSRAYFAAIEDGNAATLTTLLRDHPDWLGETIARGEPGSGGTGLHLAARRGRVAVAKVLLRHGIAADARNDEGRTALHEAIEQGHASTRDLLIAHGATIDICAAAILGRVDLVSRYSNEDPSLANDTATGLSPLGWAAFGNQVEAAEVLLNRGARIEGDQLLCAASAGHVEVGRLLLSRGADPNALIGGAGENALHAAVRMRHTPDATPFVSLLLQFGADPSIRSSDGKTPLELAAALGHRQAMRLAEGTLLGEPRDFDGAIRLLRQAYQQGGAPPERDP